MNKQRKRLPSVGDRVRINTGFGLFHGNEGTVLGVHDDALSIQLDNDLMLGEGPSDFLRWAVELA